MKECKEGSGVFRMENKLKESNTAAKQNQTKTNLRGCCKNPDK